MGLKQILWEPSNSAIILSSIFCEAVEMVRGTIIEHPQRVHGEVGGSCRRDTDSISSSTPMDYTVLQIVREYGDKIVLTESDGKPRTSKRKGKRRSSNSNSAFKCKEERVYGTDEWQGPAPWDFLLGGDGSPKFLCDVMVSTKQHSFCSSSDYTYILNSC